MPHSVTDLAAPRPYRVADLGPFKLLDVTATCDADGHELMLAVVNRDRERAHPTTIHLTDAATMTEIVAYEVNGADPDTVNSFEQPHAVDVQEHRLDQKGQSISYTFAPHSFTLLCVHLA